MCNRVGPYHWLKSGFGGFLAYFTAAHLHQNTKRCPQFDVGHPWDTLSTGCPTVSHVTTMSRESRVWGVARYMEDDLWTGNPRCALTDRLTFYGLRLLNVAGLSSSQFLPQSVDRHGIISIRILHFIIEPPHSSCGRSKRLTI